LTDIYTIVSPLSRNPAPAGNVSATRAKPLLAQLAEATAALASAQVLHRSSSFSLEKHDPDNGMDIDGPKRRISLGGQHGHSPEKLLRELAADLIIALPAEGEKLLVKLREKLEAVFPDN
jgi:hypothetical protein